LVKKVADTKQLVKGKHPVLVNEIELFCESVGIAESTFGRLAVNDGKFVNRIRGGSKVGEKMVARVQEFMSKIRSGNLIIEGRHRRRVGVAKKEMLAKISSQETTAGLSQAVEYNEQRQSHSLFYNSCNEKWQIAQRAFDAMNDLSVSPPALRVFEANLGEGTTLARLLRALHHKHPTVPFLIVARERGLSDLRNSLGKMADRLLEHPLTVVVITNMNFEEAATLTSGSVQSALAMNWKTVRLDGNTAYDFQTQISGLQQNFSEDWAVKSQNNGQPKHETPNVLVLYRKDHEFLLHNIVPKPGSFDAQYDFIIAAHLYRHDRPISFKIDKILLPLVKCLAPGGRALVVQSYGNDPAHEIAHQFWSEEELPTDGRQKLIAGLKHAIGDDTLQYKFTGATDKTSLFRYDMHTLPIDINEQTGISTLLAAWSNAVFVSQVPRAKVDALVNSREDYLKASTNIINKHGGLWFINESFVIKRDV
tara:strand:- start:2783 stop:4219 length:1437 start_codon:yes stop_codon:yes gene_type:complete